MSDSTHTSGQVEPPHEALLAMLKLMVRVRLFEEAVARLFKRGQLPGFVHLCIGQEAVAVGACSALRADDRITSTHRGHGHLLAKGASPNAMMAELLGKATGISRGRGGSMHAVDFSLGVLGTNGIVGGGIPIATGAAWADRQLGRDSVTVCFFGDGASNQGVLLEALNLAAVWALPVIFCCENNGYGEWTRTTTVTAGRIADRAQPFGVPGIQIDGNDVVAVHRTVAEAVDRARRGGGPSLIECVTYRWSAHNEGEEAFSGKYRPDEEIAAWKERDPIAELSARLSRSGVARPEDVAAIIEQERELIGAAVEFAQASDYPDPDTTFDHGWVVRVGERSE